MDLIVNGVSRTVQASTVEALLQEYVMERKLVVVEIDGTIVPREQWPDTALTAGMKIELVHFVGGG
ncbi:sulfur carrier protein ThiS [Paenibacillus koleovorans]|uniref:sulfur carrier protein ThiS n=1 Tax=Paenibacillus koleovorans TaxID=121608 RepID=UPI000FD9E6D4|nr:sulfur carrier protein ThiS [Paenibacillus koleovorans]